MYPITNAVKALFEAEQNKVLRITGTDGNGTSISITDADVRRFAVDRFSCAGAKLEVGSAIAAEMDLTLDNSQGSYDGIVFEGTELYVEIGIADWSQQTPSVSYIPIGYFTPDKQPRKLSIITIKALDRMTRFDAYIPILTPWTDNNGNVMTDGDGTEIDFSAEFEFPCTVAELIEQCCVRCQMPFTQDISALPNAGLTISAMPSLQQEITFRTVIQWCAGIMGTCAYVDWNGNLVFKWYASASYTCTQANRLSSDLYEADIAITGIAYTNTSGATLISGSDGYCIDLTGNYLAAAGIATILPVLNTALNGFTYRPFEATVLAAPYLWPLDIITFTDKDGNDHDCILTNVNIGLNGNTALAGKGETEQMNSNAQPSGVTPDQAQLIEKIAESVVQFDDSLTQEEIFNRLTDNGQTQGLILYNGKLYLNVSYAMAGTLLADYIKGGTLTLGGNDDVNGLMEVLNADGNVIVALNNEGAQINSGTMISYSDDGQQRIYISSGEVKIQYYGVDGQGNPAWVNLLTLQRSSTTSHLNSSSGLIISANNTIRITNVSSSFPYGGMIEIGDGSLSIYGGAASIVMDGNGRIIFTGSPSFSVGVSGNFITADGKSVTVSSGLITTIA